MNYAVGHSFNMDEMFMNFPYKNYNSHVKIANE